MIRFGSRVDIWLPDRVEILDSSRPTRGGRIEHPSAVAMSNFETTRAWLSRRPWSQSALAPRNLSLTRLLTVANHGLRLRIRRHDPPGKANFPIWTRPKGHRLSPSLFDSFDGFVARATGTSSEFGKNSLIHLPDMVSFGIALRPSWRSPWGVRRILPKRLS